MTIWSRWAAPAYKNTGSVARDHLASERTFLAWIRTGLGLITLGFAIERFSRLEVTGVYEAKSLTKREKRPSQDELDSHIMVGVLMTTGTGSILYATKRYFRTLHLLEREKFRPAYGGVATLGLVMGVLGGAVLAETASTWLTTRQESSRED